MANKGLTAKVARNSGVLLCFLVVVACQEDVHLQIDQRTSGEIYVGAQKPGEVFPCIMSLSISAANAAEVKPYWLIHKDPQTQGNCVSQVTYPHVPNGYYLVHEPDKLVSGKAYNISVGGSGFSAEGNIIRSDVVYPSGG